MILVQGCFTSIDGSKECDWLWPIMLQLLRHCHLTRLSDWDVTCIWLQWYLLYIYLLAKHCHTTFRKLLTPGHVTFNLTCTISYGCCGTHVVIYYLYSLIEDTTLSFGLCKASDLIGFSLFRTCMLRIVKAPL